MIQLISAMIIWGSLGMFALWSGLSAIELAFYRCLIGAGILGIYCWTKSDFRYAVLKKPDVFYAVMGGICIVLNWILLFKSFQLASITIGNVSYYLQPVFLVILGIVFFREFVTGIQWLFILITTLGVMLTGGSNLGVSSLNNTELLGIACAVGAGLLYAFATIFIKLIKEMPPSLITLVQLAVGFILLIPLVNPFNNAHYDSYVLFNVLIIGIVHTALAYILYYQSLKTVNLTLVAILSYIDPIVAIFTDVVFFDRSLTGVQTLGILLTFIGSYQVIRIKKNSPKRDHALFEKTHASFMERSTQE